MCDRIISPLKSALKRYCNEGNDILSASDIHCALEARKVKGTTSAVCEIDSNQAVLRVDPMARFSSYHNFCSSRRVSSYPVPIELAQAS